MAEIKEFQNKHRTEWQEFLWERLLESIAKAGTSKGVGQILNELLGEYEKSLITKRLAATALIRSGRGSKEISELLWLSYSTISALKKNLLTKDTYKSQRKHKTGKQGSPKNKILENPRNSYLEDILGNIDLWELIKNPPRPSSLGVIGRRDVSGYRRNNK